MERDLLLDELQALPSVTPSAALDAEVRAAAHAILATPQPSLGMLIFYRGLLPTLLSGFSAAYLFWAVQAASRLY